MTATTTAMTTDATLQSLPGLSGEIAALAERISPSVVQVGQRDGNGAGIIWRPDGLIVTNRHVVRGETAEVALTDGRRFTGQVVARHPKTDIALIRIEARDLPAATIGDSRAVRSGQLALAIGHPIGYRLALTAGIVVAPPAAETGEPEWLQTDVTLLPGNSGGPLLDAAGAVIGMNTMVAGQLSLVVPAHTIDSFVGADGQRGGFLGIEGALVTLPRDQGAGVVISRVVPGGAAELAGLLLGDIIVRVGAAPIVDQETLPAVLAKTPPGISLALGVIRGGAPLELSVIPGDRP